MIENDIANWSYGPIINADEEQVRQLRNEGASFREIEKSTGISESKAQRFNV